MESNPLPTCGTAVSVIGALLVADTVVARAAAAAAEDDESCHPLLAKEVLR